MGDPFRAFIRSDVQLPARGSGVLNGLRFAAKDNIDVKGYVTSAGNPDWLRTHSAAMEDADVIVQLLNAGASLVGKTHTDELMYSLNGENYHYGTPVNPKAPDRIPGGSSSGSAVAVASGMVEFALGTDTGGSVRIPSSYCGIFGIRPTHGRISMRGVVKLAPSFCTVGWMASSAKVLRDVGKVLLGDNELDTSPRFVRCVVPIDVIELADFDIRQQLLGIISGICDYFDEISFITLSEEGLDTWLWAFRILQAREIWSTHGSWIEKTKPKFGPGIAERFSWASTVTYDMERFAQELRQRICIRLNDILDDNTIMIMPTAPGGAPPLNWEATHLENWRNRVLKMTCIAGLGGLPQVSIPCMSQEGRPVGCSFISAKGTDMKILEFAEEVYSAS